MKAARETFQAMDPPPEESAPAALTPDQLVETLQKRFLELDEHLLRINKEREVLQKINGRMDIEIEKGTGMVTQLRERADALEEENEKKRAENEALRQRIAKMKAMLDKM